MKTTLFRKTGLVLGLILLTLLVGVASHTQAIRYIPGINPNPNPSPSPVPMASSITKNLHVGMKNDAQVKYLQTLLIKLGYLKSAVTGNFGIMTATAVKAFQQANGLEAVGSVGPQTRLLIVNKASGSVVGTNMPVKATINTSRIIPKQNAACTINSPQSVTILTPNGGETYTVGDTMTVTWSGCDPSNSTPYQLTYLELMDSITQNRILIVGGGSPMPLVGLNDSYSFTIPASGGEISLVGGNHYKIYLMLDTVNTSNYHAYDYSDNDFTINRYKVETLPAGNVTSNSAVLYGDAIGGPATTPQNWFEWGTTMSLGNQSPQTAGSYSLSGLTPSTNYYYKFCEVDPLTSQTICGDILTFTTLFSDLCEYPAPPAGYHYAPGPNYVAETQCGMVLTKNAAN